ncbi:MAG: FAD-dependent oxidoreductase [Candidatus Dojkabacteria bacterium]
MKYDYIVVGAGIAGLYTAYQLKKQGFNVLVLERDQDPGGRMRSAKIDGDYENIGASFITNSYTHLLQLAKELKLKLKKPESIVHNIGIVDEKGKINHISGNIKDILQFNKVPFYQKLKFLFLAPIIVFQSFFNSVPNYSRLVQFDNESMKEYISRTVGKEFSKYFIESAVYNLFSHSGKLFSKAIAIGVFKHLIQGRKYYDFKKGLEELPIKISQKVEIIYNFEVDKIKRNGGYVIVTSKNDKMFESSKVIVALPGNKVLKLIDEPNVDEKEFFSKVKYSSHIKIFCESNDEILRKYDRIVFAGEKNIASINVTHKEKDFVKFSFGIPDLPAKKLLENKDLSEAILEEFIKENLPFKLDFKVMELVLWDSALPIFYTGYIKRALKFKQTNTIDNPIVYVGDYLSGPFLEGAILSAVEVFGFK